MGLPNEIHPLQLCASSGAYQINQSLRFDGSAYLNRTPASAGNRKTWTWSGWVKRGTLGTTQAIWGNYFGANDSSQFRVYFNSDNTLYVGFYSFSAAVSNAVFRDISAWYHISVSFDSTQSTASNRLKVYVNGTELSWATDNRSSITQNGDFAINAAQAHYIGYSNVADYFDGYLAEVNFIDGTALTPSSFGETDTITGAWIPKKYSGSYGTNGFYLKFESSGIGTDSSGNSNTWTANNFSTSGTGTDVMSDTPTNNYATLNPLITPGNTALTNGNLEYSTSQAEHTLSSFGMTEGKWYCEATLSSSSANIFVGLVNGTQTRISSTGSTTLFVIANDGANYYPNSTRSYNGSTSLAAGDVVGLALDATNKTCNVYKNNTLIYTFDTFTLSGPYYFAFDRNSATTVTNTVNFGQRSFSYTPSTGYKALNTANLPEPTIKKGSTYFDTVTYSGATSGTAGAGTTQAVTGLGFSPDLVWIKNRSNANSHGLFDQVRGAVNALRSDLTNAEATTNSSGALSAFNSNGFTLANGSSGSDQAILTHQSGYTYVAWAWDANGAGSSNTAGSITSTVSANATAGFSIVTYTSPNSASDQTVGHGLGVKPSFIIVKNRDLTYNWDIYHASLGYNASLIFTTASTRSGAFGAEPTSTVFTTKTGYTHNSTNTYVAYCFSEVAGYSKFGSYTGNGSTDGPFVFCGFRPAWVLFKPDTAGTNWSLVDTKRSTYNPTVGWLVPNDSGSEPSASLGVDFLSNGFKLRTTGNPNNSGVSIIFAAFSETAFKFANAR